MLASDGVDRSLQNKRSSGFDIDYIKIDLSSPSSIQDALAQIAKWAEADRDNMKRRRSHPHPLIESF